MREIITGVGGEGGGMGTEDPWRGRYMTRENDDEHTHNGHTAWSAGNQLHSTHSRQEQ